ncbi:hypothetical protein ACHAXT_000160, partial [Thalassiosira profunda]
PPSRLNNNNSGVALRLVSLLCVSILVALASVIRQHARLDPSTVRGNNGNGNNGPWSIKEARRAQREIQHLEKELRGLAAEYGALNVELTKLSAEADGGAYGGAAEAVAKKRVAFHPREEKEALKREMKEAMRGRSKQKLAETAGEDASFGSPAVGPAAFAGRHPKDREIKKWWLRRQIFAAQLQSPKGSKKVAEGDKLGNGRDGDTGAIVPIDLSVNHLQLIERAGGSPNQFTADAPAVAEEFLPVVTSSDVTFRWRSRARPHADPRDAAQTSAYRIVAWRAHARFGTGAMLWDSGKIDTPDGLPDAVSPTKDSQLLHAAKPGAIIIWRVTVWDAGNKPSTSEWSKFALGPRSDEWAARWISHPIDLEAWDVTDAGAFWGNNREGHQDVACRNWERRSQLPMFRAKLPSLEVEGDEVQSALLVVSGLGSFRASLDGTPLSSSGPLDPPLTDFAQRAMYRGFDVTPFLVGEGSAQSHVVGVAMGSGWWDHRPIGGSFIRLFYFPHGAVTTIAQLHVTYQSGDSRVLLATGDEEAGWQVAKGPLRESSLFSGEYVDLQSMASFEGWDTAGKWTALADEDAATTIHSWVPPQIYVSDTTLDEWRTTLHMKANAKRPNARRKIVPRHKLAPIGRLTPHEIPPVMPVERLEPDEVYGLGDGRWMYDFGRGISGVVRFEEGLPSPIVPENYPRGHTVSTLPPDESFITVLYGESLELTRGDVNLPVVAGMGLHDGGPKHKSKPAGGAEAKGGPCYPKDHIEAGSLLQRDVYILPRNASGEDDDESKGSFAEARQSHFTTHAFRFVEICCTAQPPSGVTALAYRTAFNEWGRFGSSNVRLNGGYELVANALNSNLLGVQSDCPHREKIQYGGDIVADSPAALHLYDMSAFYRKVVRDWGDQQWDNGAYAGTSHWLALNDYASAGGEGSGETVWASAPVVMTARHNQHYGDAGLVEETFANHERWFEFLVEHFDKGLKKKGYDEELRGYTKEGSGLGDWLTFRGRDTWLTHQSFYMATARCLAYLASKLGKEDTVATALQLANAVKERITRLYLQPNGAFLPPERGGWELSPGPEMSLYSRTVPGNQRCMALRRYFRRKGHTWPGSDEMTFVREMSDATRDEMIASGEITKRGGQWAMGWSQWHGFNEGIFAVRYALKTLSDNGFHHVALAKANGFGCGTFEYMLSHNATTHWESWW